MYRKPSLGVNDKRIAIFSGLVPLVEDARRVIEQGSFPVVDHRRVDTESSGELTDGLLVLQCGQRHLGLESGEYLFRFLLMVNSFR